MKKIAILALLIPAVVGIINIYDWLWPNTPDVKIYQSSEEINLPKPYLEKFKHLSWSNERELHNFLSKIKKDKTSDQIVEAIELVTSKEFYEPISYPSRVSKLRVINVGGKPASDLKIVFPQRGLIEIDQIGEAVKILPDAAQINFSTLSPDVEIKVNYWSPYAISGLDKLIASHKDGKVKIIKANVYRNENNFVVSIDSTEVKILLLLITLFVFYAILQFIEFRKKSKTTTKHKSKKSEK